MLLRVLGRLLIALAALGAILFAANWAAVAAAQAALEKAMPAVLGPAREYTVRLEETTLWDLLHGQLKGIHIEARALSTSDGLVLDLLSVDIYEAGLGGRALVSLGKVSFKALLREDAVNQYLAARPGPGPIPMIRLEERAVRLAAVKRILLVNVPLELLGRLDQAGRARLRFVPDQLKVGPLVLGHALTRLLLAKADPVVDLSGLPILLDIQRVEVRPTRLLLTGDAHIPLPQPFPHP